ncbi:MAG: leucyl/phenylalanyl-tRNA--protein transferase [Pusillimonas sp.]
MTVLPWVSTDTPLPDVSLAQPDGLLAAGMDLSVSRFEEAYRKGVFPWFSEGDPVLWWSPDPRMVLPCHALKLSKSLAKKLRQIERTETQTTPTWQVTVDTVFEHVIDACGGPRRDGAGTWISSDIKAVYRAWHVAGRVHSIETWHEGKLVGGLYGVSLGGFFFGESMFSHMTDASKIALVYLVNFLRAQGVDFIDCQQETRHLASLGARPVPRKVFMGWLESALIKPGPVWQPGPLLQCGRFASDRSQCA